MILASSGVRQGHVRGGHLKGFTLIELLVVIAIIGILSSVVLASLNTARNKGADAAVKSNLESIRPQAELYYDSNSSKYATALGATNCATTFTASTMLADPTITNALKQTYINNGSQAFDCGVPAAGDAYSIAVPLKTAGFWCIDSTGVARDKDTNGTPYAVLVGATGAHLSAASSVCR